MLGKVDSLINQRGIMDGTNRNIKADIQNALFLNIGLIGFMVFYVTKRKESKLSNLYFSQVCK